MLQGHVWEIVENPQSPKSSNWVALERVSLETNASSQSVLSCVTRKPKTRNQDSLKASRAAAERQETTGLRFRGI